MGNYEQLKQSVSDVIKTNGNQEITGSILQNVLLTIISTVGANATFAGIATPTTNPGTPDGPIFYLASESGTYTNFGSVELQDGLSVLMWNGSWSSQQILSIDNVPTAGSDNLVKSGGVAEELALGTVYDVSAKNPTAGVNNDGKWESLSVLLSDTNLSTLIPTAVRKGGMSIKFIQSSDNKYVQYRLMSDTFNTTVTNWQGIEDEPTAGSSNLIKSYGIARQYGTYIENENYVYAKLDSEGKILFAIDREGNIIFGAGIPPQIKQAIDELKELSGHYINSSKYIKVITDSDNKILQYFNSKGIVNFPAGIESPTIDSLKGNILNGKKYAFCGDSFTEAIFSGITDSEGRIGMDSPELYDSVRRMWKSYGWWVIDRNNMKYYADGVSGSRMTAIYDGGVIQNPNAFCNQRYMNVPKDSDYITLMFGLNETNVSIGDENSTDDSTLWGAYNKVLEYFLTEMPYAKVGIIISDAWMVGTNIATTIKNIAKYWGIPYLDLGGDDRVSMRIGGKSYPVSQTAKSLRNAAFQISPSNSHPNQYGHKYMSSIVENFLRTL